MPLVNTVHVQANLFRMPSYYALTYHVAGAGWGRPL